MKRVLQVLLVLIAAVALVCYFLIDVLLKSAIEREGAKALQAELNIASVNFRLFPLGIVLNDVQATNPQQPLRNLVTAERVAATFTLAQILDHKIVVDDMQLSGLRFNQARLRSGAIPGLTPEPKPALTAAGLPGLSLPDPDALLTAEKALVQNQLRTLRDELTQTRDSWQQRLLTLPDQAKLDGYRQRAQALRQGSAIDRVAASEQLRREISAELDRLNTLREQARADWQRAQTQLEQAQTLPQRELERVLAGAGLSRGADGLGDQGSLTQALIGAEFAPLIAQLQGLANLPQGAAAAQSTDAAPWLVLARSINLDGQFDIGRQALAFTGVVHNVTPQPQVWDVATDFALQAAPDQPGKFTLAGTLDQRKGVSANVRLALAGLPLTALPLSSAEMLKIDVEKSLLDVEGLLRMEGYQIDFGVFSVFRQAKLQISAGDNAIAQTLATALRTINQFDVNVLMVGDVRSPQVKLQSSLDQILAAAVGDQVRAQTAQLAEKMQTQLQRDVQPELDAIRLLGNDFQAMQQTLLDKQDVLQGLLDVRGVF